jgi:hypothetical protein
MVERVVFLLLFPQHPICLSVVVQVDVFLFLLQLTIGTHLLSTFQDEFPFLVLLQDVFAFLQFLKRSIPFCLSAVVLVGGYSSPSISDNISTHLLFCLENFSSLLLILPDDFPFLFLLQHHLFLFVVVHIDVPPFPLATARAGTYTFSGYLIFPPLLLGCLLFPPLLLRCLLFPTLPPG